jgi:hypothetical protein
MTDFLLGQPSGDQLCREIALSLTTSVSSVSLQLADTVDGSVKLSGQFETSGLSTAQRSLFLGDLTDAPLHSDTLGWNQDRTIFTARLVNNGKLIGVFTIATLSPLSSDEAREFEMLVGTIVSQIKLYLALRSPELIAAPREVVVAPVGRVKFLSDRQARVIERRKESSEKNTIAQRIGLSALQIEEDTVQIFKKLSPEELTSVALKAIASGLIAI